MEVRHSPSIPSHPIRAGLRAGTGFIRLAFEAAARRSSANPIVVIVFICISIALSSYIRVAGIPVNLESVMGSDPPRYIEQARTILDQGKLPWKETHRDSPLGRDVSLQLTVFQYTLAYGYRFVSAIGIPFSFEQFAVLSPVLFYALSSVLIAVLTWQLYGSATALLAVNLAGFSPLLVGRTAAGYADRDSFTLFLALAAFSFYILRFRRPETYGQQLLLMTLCAAATVLVALTWEGAAVFATVIATCEVARMLFSRSFSDRDVVLTLAWAVPVALIPPLFKETYRLGAAPHVALMVGYPSMLALSAGLVWFARRNKRLNTALSDPRKPPVGFLALVASSVILGVFANVDFNNQSKGGHVSHVYISKG